MHNLCSYHHPPSEWFICYSWWTYNDTSFSLEVWGLHYSWLLMLSSPWPNFVVICILHYSITHSLFIALKSCVLPVFPPFLSPWWVNCWSFYGLRSSRMSYSWKHTSVAFSHWLLSLSNVHLSFVHVLIAHFKVLNNIPLSGLSIHWPKDILVASNFWQLQIGLL